MVVLARGHHRAAETRECLCLTPAGHQGHRQFDIDPGLRPVVRRGRPGRQRGHQLGGGRVVLAERSHQLGSPADGQDRAADNFLDADRHQHRGLYDAALHVLLGIVEAALADVELRRIGPLERPPRARAPGDHRHVGRGPDAGREDHADHPVGERQVDPDRAVVLIECLVQFAHLVIALTHHGVVADGVDPARLDGLHRPAPLLLELLQGQGVVSLIVERADGREIGVGGDAPHLGLRLPRCPGASHRKYAGEDRQQQSRRQPATLEDRAGPHRCTPPLPERGGGENAASPTLCSRILCYTTLAKRRSGVPCQTHPIDGIRCKSCKFCVSR